MISSPTHLAAAFLVLAAACGGDEGEAGAPADDPIKVGAIFDLTGPTADVGTHYADGVRGYADWVNRQGGIEGRPIDLIYQDYGYQVGRAEQLYSQFVGEGVVIFMGWGTGDTEALQLRVAEDEIPFSSASLSHRLGDAADAPYNFLVATTYTDQFPHRPGLDLEPPRRGRARRRADAQPEPVRAFAGPAGRD